MKNRNILEGYIEKKKNLIDELMEENEYKKNRIEELTDDYQKVQDEVHRGRSVIVEMKISMQGLQAEKIRLEQELKKER